LRLVERLPLEPRFRPAAAGIQQALTNPVHRHGCVKVS
jgi:hypothetical protein